MRKSTQDKMQRMAVSTGTRLLSLLGRVVRAMIIGALNGAATNHGNEWHPQPKRHQMTKGEEKLHYGYTMKR